MVSQQGIRSDHISHLRTNKETVLGKLKLQDAVIADLQLNLLKPSGDSS